MLSANSQLWDPIYLAMQHMQAIKICSDNSFTSDQVFSFAKPIIDQYLECQAKVTDILEDISKHIINRKEINKKNNSYKELDSKASSALIETVTEAVRDYKELICTTNKFKSGDKISNYVMENVTTKQKKNPLLINRPFAKCPPQRFLSKSTQEPVADAHNHKWARKNQSVNIICDINEKITNIVPVFKNRCTNLNRQIRELKVLYSKSPEKFSPFDLFISNLNSSLELTIFIASRPIFYVNCKTKFDELYERFNEFLRYSQIDMILNDSEEDIIEDKRNFERFYCHNRDSQNYDKLNEAIHSLEILINTQANINIRKINLVIKRLLDLS